MLLNSEKAEKSPLLRVQRTVLGIPTKFQPRKGLGRCRGRFCLSCSMPMMAAAMVLFLSKHPTTPKKPAHLVVD